MTYKQEAIADIFVSYTLGLTRGFWLDELDHGRYLYYRDGILRKECEYDYLGNLVGEYKAWDNKGRLTIHQIYKNGNVIKEFDL